MWILLFCSVSSMAVEFRNYWFTCCCGSHWHRTTVALGHKKKKITHTRPTFILPSSSVHLTKSSSPSCFFFAYKAIGFVCLCTRIKLIKLLGLVVVQQVTKNMASMGQNSALNLLQFMPSRSLCSECHPFIFSFYDRLPTAVTATFSSSPSSCVRMVQSAGNDSLPITAKPKEESQGNAAEEPPPTVSQRVNDSISLAIKEPIYEVIEVTSDGQMSTEKINRRQLLKSSGLRLRDIRSVDPSLWLTNSAPTLLVRDLAILLNLGSLRAIAMQERVFIFDYNRRGGKAFLELLLPRLKSENYAGGGQTMPFELEVVEAALLSRIQHYEKKLMEVEPRVLALLEVLPNRLTADILEELRISKQALVELGSRAGALKQMLLDLLEDTDEIRRICIMGRNCVVRKGSHDVECSVPLDKLIAEEEEEEIEMLLENYLQRCESCHGQAERLLDSAKEMEDSIAVNLSSRRLEVSRLELILQVGTFCVAVGALVAGIFGMNLKSYLEDHVFAFWLTTAAIMVGGVVAFFVLNSYLKKRRIL